MNNLELTDSEHLALRYVLDNWVLTSSAQGNAPFCYQNCKAISEKLGKAPDDLWEDPICKAWYKDRRENYKDCEICGESMPKKDLKQYFADAEWMCPECFQDHERDYPGESDANG